MTAHPPPPPPDKPVIRRDGFTIKDGVITCNGYERLDAQRLEGLYRPEKAGARAQKKLVEDAKKLFTRQFFAAQLRFYGITFPKTSTEPQLKSLLDKAVMARKCDNVPQSVIRILQELQLDYQREVDAWQKLVDNWDAEWKRQQDEEWAQLETPAQRATYDLDRFMEHYFLTDGNPDSAKKPEPVALDGLTDEAVINELLTRVSLVPGLDTVTAGYGTDHTICIGWDHTALCGLAVEIENHAREQKRVKIQADWEEAMRRHSDFAFSTQAQENLATSAVPDRPLNLGNARGCFIVRCKAISEKYPDHPNIGSIAFNISDSPANNGETLRANIDFGVYQGTAILSFSQPVMDWFVRHYDKLAVEAANRAITMALGNATTGKRKASAPAGGQRPNKQAKIDADPSPGRVVVDPPPGRIFVQMRGRDPLTGLVYPEIQSGHLDFTDVNWAKFVGVFSVPGVGQDLEIEGFRVANEAVVQPEPWSLFWPAEQHVIEVPQL